MFALCASLICVYWKTSDQGVYVTFCRAMESIPPMSPGANHFLSLWNFGFFLWGREMILNTHISKYCLGNKIVTQQKRWFIKYNLSEVHNCLLCRYQIYTIVWRSLSTCSDPSVYCIERDETLTSLASCESVYSQKLRKNVNDNLKWDFLLNLKRLTYLIRKPVFLAGESFCLFYFSMVTSNQNRIWLMLSRINCFVLFLRRRAGAVELNGITTFVPQPSSQTSLTLRDLVCESEGDDTCLRACEKMRKMCARDVT